MGGGDVLSVHGVHPSRRQTHSCRFKEVAACMQHADMLSFIVLKLTAPVMQGAAAGCIKCVYLLTNSKGKNHSRNPTVQRVTKQTQFNLNGGKVCTLA